MSDPDLRRFCEQEITALLDRLYATALRLTRNRSDAEDLVADAVVKALDNLHTLRDRGCFRGWMFRILYNIFYSSCRSRAAHPEDCFSALASGEDQDREPFWLFDRLHQPFLLWWGNAEQDFVDRLVTEDLVKAIEALPEIYRVVVVLADIEGFSYQEIAQTLEIELGTVRSRLSRGRSLLQKALWSYAQDAGLVEGRPQP
ncbi:MAG: sigma-70 family RNA polymerase sigma factor [Gammaproteobacteria bacterium]|jgi:RNA polymerase sigma-70 factor (ECF subfamily)